MSASAAATFAAVLPGLMVAHHVADHWVQTPWQAANKGLAGRLGRVACASHVGTYTLVTAGTVGLLWGALDLGVTPWGFVMGQLVSAITHYWADRRTTLARLATVVGSGEFYRLGAPRGTVAFTDGAYVLDQSWHWAWLFVAALVTAVV